MDYLLSFLEGIITFISPCLLPMLPIYLSYFAGKAGEGSRTTVFFNSLGFVAGFTIVFVTLGAFAGIMGFFLKEHETILNVIAGLVVFSFGMSFLGIFPFPSFSFGHSHRVQKEGPGFLSSMLFGIVFSVSWTPCVGVFLGSALMMAATAGGSMHGILMLLCYSLGLGIPFLASALLIEQLKSTFDLIKKHYRVINIGAGLLLVAVGILMATGMMGLFLSILTF